MVDLYYCRLRGRTKVPIEKDFLNVNCTNDRTTVKSWLANGDNIGLVCAKSGLVVVDVDVKHGGVDAWAALCMEHGEPVTRIHLTPSGGKHYIFLATAGKRYKGLIQKGIDIRYNAQIVMPPSSIGTKQYSKLNNLDYEPVPEWLDSLIVKGNLKSERMAVSSSYLMDLAREVKKHDLSYEEWCQVGMAFHSSDSSNVGLNAFIEASLGPSYQDGDEDKCVEKWASFNSNRDDGITIKSIMHFIRQKGGVVPPTTSAEDFEIVSGQQSGWIEEDGKFITMSKLDCIEHFNKTHSFYTKGGRACIIQNDEVRTLELAVFNVQKAPFVFRSQKGKRIIETPASEIWVQDSRRHEVDEIVFAPKCGDREINLYHGMPKFEAVGEPAQILKLLTESLVPVREEREWLLDWLAHIVQNPFEKSSLVPVHITPEGTGKGILYELVMQKLLTRDYFVKVEKCALLSTNFNKHLANKLLTFIDEATWGGRKEEVSIIKSLTGSEKLTIEEKFGAIYTVDNVSRYVIASNEDDAVHIGAGNRRFVMLESSEKHIADVSFHDPIAEVIRRTDEVDKFGKFLLDRDISAFKPHVMPDFRNGEATKLGSEKSVGEFWQEVILGEDIKLWTDKGLPQKNTWNAYDKWRREVNHYEKFLTKHAFWKRTKKISGYKMEQKKARVGDDIIVIFSTTPYQLFNGIKNTLKININLKEEREYYANEENF